jgi:fluoride ion exporter CrcB/FEX
MQAYLAIAIGGILGCWARYAMTNVIQTVLIPTLVAAKHRVVQFRPALGK